MYSSSLHILDSSLSVTRPCPFSKRDVSEVCQGEAPGYLSTASVIITQSYEGNICSPSVKIKQTNKQESEAQRNKDLPTTQQCRQAWQKKAFDSNKTQVFVLRYLQSDLKAVTIYLQGYVKLFPTHISRKKYAHFLWGPVRSRLLRNQFTTKTKSIKCSHSLWPSNPGSGNPSPEDHCLRTKKMQ